MDTNLEIRIIPFTLANRDKDRELQMKCSESTKELVFRTLKYVLCIRTYPSSEGSDDIGTNSELCKTGVNWTPLTSMLLKNSCGLHGWEWPIARFT